MSEDTNDIQDNEAEMNKSQFKNFDISEETNHIRGSRHSMNSHEFEEKLNDFFIKHKKTKLKFVPKIVETFKGQEGAVLEHLNNKYVLGIIAASAKQNKKIAAVSEGSADHAKKIESAHSKKTGAGETASPPKSKKKLVIIGIIVIVLVGLGVTGFMMKDKLMGAAAKVSVEQGEKKAEAEAEKKSAANRTKKEAAPKAEAIDSTKKVIPDSAKTAVKDSEKKH